MTYQSLKRQDRKASYQGNKRPNGMPLTTNRPAQKLAVKHDRCLGNMTLYNRVRTEKQKQEEPSHLLLKAGKTEQEVIQSENLNNTMHNNTPKAAYSSPSVRTMKDTLYLSPVQPTPHTAVVKHIPNHVLTQEIPLCKRTERRGLRDYGCPAPRKNDKKTAGIRPGDQVKNRHNIIQQIDQKLTTHNTINTGISYGGCTRDVTRQDTIHSSCVIRVYKGRLSNTKGDKGSYVYNTTVSQRKLIMNNGILHKTKGRANFHKDIETELKVIKGKTSRNHTISYETITNSVKGPINEVLNKNINTFTCKTYLEGLMVSVFPGRNTSMVYTTNQKLKTLAATLYSAAQSNINAVIKELNNNSVLMLVVYSNELINALNSSPDNLRVGFSNTNSSIGGALDFADSTTHRIPKGKRVWYRDNTGGWRYESYTKNRDIIMITGLAAQQLIDLWTGAYSTEGISVYTDGKSLQSSNNKGQLKSNMTGHNPTPVGVMYGTEYMIFK